MDELDRNTGEARRALYERARNALLAQLRSNKPVFFLADIIKERRALEEAIGQVEADAARESRTETQELRSAAPPGRTRMAAHKFLPRRQGGTARIRLRPIYRKRMPAVLFSARERLLSVRSSRRKQSASGLREVLGEFTILAHQTTEAAKAARQTEAHELGTAQYPSAEEPSRSSREPHPDSDDLHSIDRGTWQQRGSRTRAERRGSNAPSADALKAPEVEDEQRTDPPPISAAGVFAASSKLVRPFPRLLIVSGVMTAATLNDVRVMIEWHLPAASRAKEMWRYALLLCCALAAQGMIWGAKGQHSGPRPADAARERRVVLSPI